MHVLISVDPSVKEFRVYCGEFCFISRKISFVRFLVCFFFLCKSCALYRHFLVFIATKMSRSDFRSLVSRLCEKKCIRLSFFFLISEGNTYRSHYGGFPYFPKVTNENVVYIMYEIGKV